MSLLECGARPDVGRPGNSSPALWAEHREHPDLDVRVRRLDHTSMRTYGAILVEPHHCGYRAQPGNTADLSAANGYSIFTECCVLHALAEKKVSEPRGSPCLLPNRYPSLAREHPVGRRGVRWGRVAPATPPPGRTLVLTTAGMPVSAASVDRKGSWPNWWIPRSPSAPVGGDDPLFGPLCEALRAWWQRLPEEARPAPAPNAALKQIPRPPAPTPSPPVSEPVYSWRTSRS